MKSPFPLTLALLLLLSPAPAHAAAPVVGNVRAAQRTGTKLVDIYYNVTAASAVTVTIAVSSDGGLSYSVPAAAFTGDFGSGVAPGTDRHVVWNAGTDWNGQFTTRGRVRVTAEDGSGPAGMAFIPGGTFQMGDNYGLRSDATPVRSVVVSGFYLDRFDVTKELWDQVYQWATANGYTFTVGLTGNGVAGNHPVQRVSWYDAVKWCNARSQKEGRIPAYYTDTAQTQIYKLGDVDLTAAMVKWTGNGYRLPTEAEWEKAARGGLAGHHFPWPSSGNDYNAFVSGDKANYYNSGDPFATNSVQTTPVGYYNGSQTPAGVDMINGYGLYDMAGNVWQWCWDWYGSYDSATLTDPRGAASGSYRVIRGGSWSNDANYLRCAFRYNISPSYRYYNSFGFRCALGQP